MSAGGSAEGGRLQALAESADSPTPATGAAWRRVERRQVVRRALGRYRAARQRDRRRPGAGRGPRGRLAVRARRGHPHGRRRALFRLHLRRRGASWARSSGSGRSRAATTSCSCSSNPPRPTSSISATISASAPNGHLVVCEDQYTDVVDNHLRGITPQGTAYPLAQAAAARPNSPDRASRPTARCCSSMPIARPRPSRSPGPGSSKGIAWPRVVGTASIEAGLFEQAVVRHDLVHRLEAQPLGGMARSCSIWSAHRSAWLSPR